MKISISPLPLFDSIEFIKDQKAPKYSCSGNICDKCKHYLADGHVFILGVTHDHSIGSGGNGIPNRTGHVAVIKREAAEKIFTGYDINKNQIFYMTDDAMYDLGLILKE